MCDFQTKTKSWLYPSAPIVAYKRQKNIREVVIKAKVPPLNTRPRRIQNGYKKCNYPSCLTCPYSIPGKLVKATATNYSVEVNRPVSCDTKNVIYLITCKHCREQYVGETFRTAHSRFCNHRGYVNNKAEKATGQHYNLPGHSISDMSFQIIEKVISKDNFYRKEREKMYIQKFNSKLKGLNKISWLLLIAQFYFWTLEFHSQTVIFNTHVDYYVLGPQSPDVVCVK